MRGNRCYVSTAVAHGCIYALGGYDGTVRQNSAERYDPVTNQWSLLEPMLEHRSDAGADSLHDVVYIAGGFNGTHTYCLSIAHTTCSVHTSCKLVILVQLICRILQH